MSRSPLAELAREFLRLGLTAFGGPAAHIAIMQREFVERRGWLSRERFVDLLGLSSLLPGPSSTEVALGIGFERARWPGLLIAAFGFIVPASLIVLAIAVVYGELGSLDWVSALLYGMSPVVIAVVVQAMLKLVPTACTDALTWAIGLGAFLVSLVVLQPIAILLGAALVALSVRRAPALRERLHGAGAVLAMPSVPSAMAAAEAAATLGLLGVFGSFLKMGLVVFGSGYVLIAFLGSELVAPGYITEQELLDAIAIGQLTPGPVFTTATFLGYLMAGVPGAVVATVGIFLPAVVLVGVAHPFLPRMRANRDLSAAIDGLNAAAVGLIGVSAFLLAQDAFFADGAADLLAVALGAGALVVLLGGRVGPVPLLVVGALVGFVSQVPLG
ncbi:MAG: chromate efflux transporter [Candidatus Limnocylindrales bacterium]